MCHEDECFNIKFIKNDTELEIIYIIFTNYKKIN